MATKYIGDTWSVSWGDILSSKVVVSYSIGGGEQIVIEAEAPNGENYEGEFNWVINVEENCEGVRLRVSDFNYPDMFVEFGPFDIERRILDHITISPSMLSGLSFLKSRQFVALAFDQTDTLMDPQPVFDWSTDITSGSIDQSGIFTAGTQEETGSVTATSGGISISAIVRIRNVNTQVSLDFSNFRFGF